MFSETVPANGQQRPVHLWKPGQSGNPKGRGKGVRNRLNEQFLNDLYADWQEFGAAAIIECREINPYGYVKVVADLLPKDIKLTVHAGERLERILEALERASAPMIEAIAIELGSSPDPQHSEPAAVRDGRDADREDRAVAADGAGGDRQA